MSNELTLSTSYDPIEYQGQRVVTTLMLAGFYEVTPEKIQKNYRNNLHRYDEGIHYFVITKEDKAWGKICSSPFETRPRFLWTEKGALQHAKSLGSDNAWKVYEQLIDTYFRAKELAKHPQIAIPQDYEQAIEHLLVQIRENKALNAKIESDKPKVDFAEKISGSSDSVLIGDFAKTIKIGRNTMFKRLRQSRYMYFIQGGESRPYQIYVDQGLFELKETIDARGKLHFTPLLTPKGQERFAREFGS